MGIKISKMKPRRSFFKILFHIAAGMMIGFKGGLSLISRAYAQSKRIVLTEYKNDIIYLDIEAKYQLETILPFIEQVLS